MKIIFEQKSTNWKFWQSCIFRMERLIYWMVSILYEYESLGVPRLHQCNFAINSFQRCHRILRVQWHCSSPVCYCLPLSMFREQVRWDGRSIFTMVTYFLRWTLLNFFSSFPDEQSQQKVRQLDRITCALIITSNEVKSPLVWEFWIYNFSLRILERVLGWKHCKYKEWVSFFLCSWGMNRSAEQTNRPRTALRFTRFVCPALRFIPHEHRKKDTHSLIE